MNTRSSGLPVVRRSQAYLVLVGVVVGMLTAGLAVPMIFGESISGGGAEVRTSDDLDLAAPGNRGDDGDGGGLGATSSDGSSTGAATGDGGPTSGDGSSSGAAGSTGGGDGGPTSADSTGDGAGAVDVPAPPGGLTASDRGVSATTIKVGALLLDVATVGRLGVAVATNPAQQQAAFQAFANDINDRGGINGRKLEMHYEAFDVTDSNAQIAACRKLTQEKKVFVVMAGFNTVIPNLCIYKENQTPLIASSANHPDWVFEEAKGRLITLFPRSGRMMAALVAELERVRLANKKIGILTDGLNDPEGRVMAQLDRMLKARGHKVVYKGQLSDDISTAASQVPVEVNKMQTADGTGAEVVIFLSSNAIYGTQFVNQASRQGYHPQYVSSDWASNNGDSNNNNMPEAYTGAISFTFNRGLSAEQGLGPTPLANRCRDIYNAKSGRTLAKPNVPEYGLTMSYCDDMRLFELLATKAGPQLTRDRLTAMRTEIGTFEMASMSLGSLSADKFDLADLVRTQRWVHAGCTCWTSIDDFHRPGG